MNARRVPHALVLEDHYSALVVEDISVDLGDGQARRGVLVAVPEVVKAHVLNLEGAIVRGGGIARIRSCRRA